MFLAFFGLSGFTISPCQVFSHIPGEKRKKYAEHQSVVYHPDARQGFWNEVEGVDQVDQAEDAAHQTSCGPGRISAGKEIPEHRRSRADQSREVGEFGGGAEGIHESTIECLKISRERWGLR